MTEFEEELVRRLAGIRQEGLLRELRRVDSPQSPSIQVGGESLRNFSSNDYLGLATHPAVLEAAVRAIERFGGGSGASRLICGSLAPHEELDQTLAQFKGTEAALSFSSGYAAAIGTISALLGSDDFIIVDKLVHASIVDAARLCGATLRAFAHNDLKSLKNILRWTQERLKGQLSRPAQTPRVLVVTESIFSMDGDQAPLRELVELKDAFGAWLMVDEAHAGGLYGKNGRGLIDECQLGTRVEIQMGTLGKAFGASGGFVCGSRALIDYLVNRARAFIFSTAPVPAASAAAAAAIRLVQSDTGEKLRHCLWKRVAEMNSRLRSPPGKTPSAIVPIMIGDEMEAVQTSIALREAGVFVPAVRFPTVRRGKARLRLTLSAAHTEADIEAVDHALRSTLGSKRFMA